MLSFVDFCSYTGVPQVLQKRILVQAHRDVVSGLARWMPLFRAASTVVPPVVDEAAADSISLVGIGHERHMNIGQVAVLPHWEDINLGSKNILVLHL